MTGPKTPRVVAEANGPALDLVTLSVEGGSVRVAIPSGKETIEEFTADRRDVINAALVEHGAILFRGFKVASVDEFDRFTRLLSRRQLDYVYRSTPRTSAGGRVFTASEYPADQEIPLHNENSYQREWPLKLAFFCAKPAESGGQTPIADMRFVTEAVSPQLRARLDELGVEYRRNYHAHIDLSWQTVFQSQSRQAVESFCKASDIGLEWRKDGSLLTTQVCHGLAVHPETGERFIFNQAHLFHVSALGADAATMFIEAFGLDCVPRHARFGNGDEIGDEDIAELRAAFSGQAMAFEWEAGDVLLLDNMRMAHGRRPFRGSREVFAVLMDDHAPAAPSLTGALEQ